ncbi:glycosyltransferase family 39 protein [Candidatus Sumerlaeota bacterium]|nr:glycosyltransferase family 39 protein [Candidatus Sumerlaeota bacterium]
MSVLTILAYLPALKGGFVWDDTLALHENTLLKKPGGLWEIWTTHGRIPNEEHYWPAVYTMYWIEVHLWGFNAFAFHLINVLLHALNSILLWVVLRKMKLPGAWLAAVIFAVHPVHAESVAWVHERKDVLSATFYFSAFLLFLEFRKRRRKTIITISMIFFALAMWSKTVAVTLPIAMALWLWKGSQSTEKKDWLSLIPFLVVGAALALLDVYLTRQLSSYQPVEKAVAA